MRNTLHMSMVRLKPMWLRQDLMKFFYMITSKDDSMWRLIGVLSVAQVVVKHNCINLHEHACICGKTLVYRFSCNQILTTCHFCSIDFRPLVQHYYSTKSYYNTWASCSISSSMCMSGILTMVWVSCILSWWNMYQMDNLNQVICIMK